MTEQERQGKTIARMANDLLDWFTKNSLTDYLKGFGGMPAACMAIAEYIVTKNNLRNVVVEEAQKEIFTALYKKVNKLLFDNSKTTRDKVLAGKCKAYAEIKELILETAKECGAEVKE